MNLFDPQVLAFALGVSALLAHSATAFLALKIAGACYLAWLGIQSLCAGLRGVRAEAPGDVVAARVPAMHCCRSS